MNSVDQATAILQFSSYYDNVLTHTKNYCQQASASYTWMNKKVLLLCSNVSKPAAIIIYSAWRAAPYIAADLFLPTSLYLAGVIAYVAYKVILTPSKNTPNLSSVKTGIGIAAVISGAATFLFGCATHAPLSIIKGVVWGGAGGALLWHSGLIEKIVTASNNKE